MHGNLVTPKELTTFAMSTDGDCIHSAGQAVNLLILLGGCFFMPIRFDIGRSFLYVRFLLLGVKPSVDSV